MNTRKNRKGRNKRVLKKLGWRPLTEAELLARRRQEAARQRQMEMELNNPKEFEFWRRKKVLRTPKVWARGGTVKRNLFGITKKRKKK